MGGLSTGCYAQLNGYHTEIFEKHTHSGGLAATWKRKDYRIDGGIHFLTGHKPGIAFYKILREIGINPETLVDSSTYGRFLDENSGVIIDITNNANKLYQTLLNYFPDDSLFIEDLIKNAKKLSKYDLSVFGLEKPVELKSKIDDLKEFWALKGILKYFTGKYNRSVDSIAKQLNHEIFGEFLKKIFLPQVPYWFVLMILSLVFSNQLCLLRDGSNEFAKSIERRYLALGGKIHFSSGVKKIIVEKGSAIGVQLENGIIEYADYIISSTDGFHTLFHLLGKEFVDEATLDRYNQADILNPCLIISFGVDQAFPEEPWLTVVVLNEPITVGNQEIHEIVIRIFNYSSYFAPPEKTVVQVLIETEWDFWNELSKDQSLYTSYKQEIAKLILIKLEVYFPGLSRNVQVTDVATPYTFWHFTQSTKGSIMGWAPNVKNMLTQPKKSLPTLTNFYLAGQWSMSVGGVSPSILSGRHVVQLLCTNDSRKFRTR